MKIKFEKLVTEATDINVKFSETVNRDYSVTEAKLNGIYVDPEECDDLEDIYIKGKVKTVQPDTRGLNDKFKSLKYVTVKFENLSTYLEGLEANTVNSPYKLKITEVPAENLVSSASGTGTSLGAIIKNNPTKYVSLKFDDSLSSVTDGTNLFYNCKNLVEIDVSSLSNITNATSLFNNCTSLIKVSNGNFSKVENASKMFYSCSVLANLNNVSFGLVDNANSMFCYCSALDTIDTTGFTHVTNATAMFQKSGISNINTTNFGSVTTATGMFKVCTHLTSIDTTPFTSVTSATGMFGSCTLTAYYASENDNLYKNFKDTLSGTITWTLKTA